MEEFLKKPVILASSSERRISLLKKSGINFTAVNHKLPAEPHFEEFNGNISVGGFVQNLALMKAKSLLDDYPENWIVGSDTVICCNGTVYGKPENIGEAFNTLKDFYKRGIKSENPVLSLRGALATKQSNAEIHRTRGPICFARNDIMRDSSVTWSDMLRSQ